MFGRKFNRLFLFGLVGCLLLLLGWLVVPKPKEAKADIVSFMVYIKDLEGNELTPDDGIDIWFRLYRLGQAVFADMMQYSNTTSWYIVLEDPPEWTEWSVRIFGRNYDGIDPDTQEPLIPVPITSLYWVVELQ